MKNVLVTGGAGFIGSNFINYMVRKYPHAHFYNIDCLNYCSSKKNIDDDVVKADNYTFIKGKIQERDLIEYILLTHNIDTVVHFAAQSHVDNSFDNSLEYTYDNVYGTHVLLECCRLYGKIRKFVHISTDEVYGESHLTDDEEDKKHEASVLCPTNPYAATKGAAELIARSYFYSYKFPVVITRGNNVFGPKQYTEKVVPRFISLLQQGKPCTIQGNGEHKRAFIYVDDVVRAVETILDKGASGEIYNIGFPHEVSVMELAEMLIKRIKGHDASLSDYITFVPDRCFNDKRYYISDEKLKALGWSSEVSFLDGLERTLQWYLTHVDLEKHWTH
jgi:UDP-glucose 4,6-dehydratase